MTDCTIHLDELDRPDVRNLLALHFAEMRSHSPPDACHVLPPEELPHPSITIFSARREGRLLGIGALKELDPLHGEVKSMRTATNILGQGVGKALLAAIVAEARRRRYERLSLETGSTPEFAPALRLYETAGFQPCAPFEGYRETPFTRFLSLKLHGSLHR